MAHGRQQPLGPGTIARCVGKKTYEQGLGCRLSGFQPYLKIACHCFRMAMKAANGQAVSASAADCLYGGLVSIPVHD
jgi:hypothetical protein